MFLMDDTRWNRPPPPPAAPPSAAAAVCCRVDRRAVSGNTSAGLQTPRRRLRHLTLPARHTPSPGRRPGWWCWGCASARASVRLQPPSLRQREDSVCQLSGRFCQHLLQAGQASCAHTLPSHPAPLPPPPRARTRVRGAQHGIQPAVQPAPHAADQRARAEPAQRQPLALRAPGPGGRGQQQARHQAGALPRGARTQAGSPLLLPGPAARPQPRAPRHTPHLCILVQAVLEVGGGGAAHQQAGGHLGPQGLGRREGWAAAASAARTDLSRSPRRWGSGAHVRAATPRQPDTPPAQHTCRLAWMAAQ